MILPAEVVMVVVPWGLVIWPVRTTLLGSVLLAPARMVMLPRWN